MKRLVFIVEGDSENFLNIQQKYNPDILSLCASPVQIFEAVLCRILQTPYLKE